MGGVLLFTRDFKDSAGEWLTREAFEEKIQGLQEAADIPQKLRKYANLDKDTVIIGVSDRAEIWAAETWNALEEDNMTPEKMAACMEALGV